MQTLKHAALSLFELLKQIWRLPEAIANISRQRQQRTIIHELELERLDRIRNPEKYRGK